jgi:hypothetical protein
VSTQQSERVRQQTPPLLDKNKGFFDTIEHLPRRYFFKSNAENAPPRSTRKKGTLQQTQHLSRPPSNFTCVPTDDYDHSLCRRALWPARIYIATAPGNTPIWLDHSGKNYLGWGSSHHRYAQSRRSVVSSLSLYPGGLGSRYSMLPFFSSARGENGGGDVGGCQKRPADRTMADIFYALKRTQVFVLASSLRRFFHQDDDLPRSTGRDLQQAN